MSRLPLTPNNIPAFAADPTTPTLRTGDTYYNTTNSTVYVYTGSAWTALAGGASGVSSIIAGTNITISPAGGTGNVTINATGGSSFVADDDQNILSSQVFG